MLDAISKRSGSNAEAMNKREEMLKKLEDLQDEVKKLDDDIAKLKAKRTIVRNFLTTLGKLDGPLTEFDPLIFQATIHHVTVFRDCTVKFTFRDGTEVDGTV